MLLKEFEIGLINYWCASTIAIDEVIYDVLIINYTNLSLNLIFKFKRYKALCFYEAFLDYGITYTRDHEYTELKQQLFDIIPYLELSKDIKELEL